MMALLTSEQPQLVSVPSSGSRKDIDSHLLPAGKVYTPNPNESSGTALGMEPLEDVLEIGSLVYVTSYGPYRGLKGIVRTVDVIAPTDAPLYFYLIDLQEGHTKEPVWFMHDDVAAVEGQNVS